MATRIYLSATNYTVITPGLSATWNKTTGFVRKVAHAVNDGSTLADSGTQVGTGTNPNNATQRQFVVEEALTPGQTISGTLKGQISMFESNAALNASAQLIVRVFAADGTTVRATLYGGHTAAAASEFLTTRRNTTFPLSTVAPVSITSYGPTVLGDRLVIEPGARIYSTDTTSTFTGRYGGSGASDYADADETDSVSTKNPWIEFSATLTFGPVAEVTTGTGAANAAAGSVQPAAGNASATGAASNATTTVATTAGAASATGVSQAAAPSVFVNAGIATATGAANSAGVATGAAANAGVAAATGAANTPSLSVSASLGMATATGAASGVAASIKPTAGLGTATGAANQPSTTQGVSANAGAASGAGAANAPAASIAPIPGTGTAQGTANAPHPGVLINADVSTGTGQANDPTVSAASTTPGRSIEAIYATTDVLAVHATYSSTEGVTAPRSVELVA